MPAYTDDFVTRPLESLTDVLHYVYTHQSALGYKPYALCVDSSVLDYVAENARTHDLPLTLDYLLGIPVIWVDKQKGRL